MRLGILKIEDDFYWDGFFCMNELTKLSAVGIVGTLGAVLGGFVAAIIPGGLPSEIVLLTLTTGGITLGFVTIKFMR